MQSPGTSGHSTRENVPFANHLAGQKSPYLLQHVTNPVDWYPWGDEAFARAARENKPVFLSIGYATCHWCHVMAHESFEDEEVAAALNRTFVCIKVDREERPDIDAIFIDAAQAMTGRGGWPLTIVMTPEKKPFFAATYIPKTGKFGMTGLLEILPQIAGIWNERRKDLEDAAEDLLQALRKPETAGPTDIDPGLLDEGYEELAARFDESYAGFGGAPKFPSLHTALFLFRYHQRTKKKHALAMATKTLLAISWGGIYDHIGGGVHRYATDRRWQVPHFEKMLYDQAMLLAACTEAYQATRQEEFRRIAMDVVAYVLRDLTSPEGMLWSAEDADSEGGEGAFYLWTADELDRLLGPEDAGIARAAFNIRPEGNFDDHEGHGRNILYLTKALRDLAGQLKIPEPELEQRVQSIRTVLFDARKKRPRPLCDDKVLADWNGLFIAALARASFVFDNREYLAAAEKAMQALLGHLYTPGGGLLHRYRDSEAAIPAFGSDYAFVISALIQLYGASFDPRYLSTALDLQEYFSRHFSDPAGGFFTVSDEAEELLVRKKEIYDGAIPSCNSVALEDLLVLGQLTGDERYTGMADRTARAYAGIVRQSPASYGYFLCALDRALGPSIELVIAGETGDPGTRTMIDALRSRYLPNLSLLRITAKNAATIHTIAPFTRKMTGPGGVPTAYVCSGRSCAVPVTDTAAMCSLLAPDNK